MANELTKIPKFRRCVLQNFPFIEQDFDALTDYQLLCKVVEYLNKVITSQNEVIDVSESLTVAFNQLHSFVQNYFENLDVQDEINNKLDQMAEDGTLQEIIAAYIQAKVAWCFDTVADMKASGNLVAGSYVQTLGFHEVGDSGGSLYIISDTGTSNEYDVIAVGNLFAIAVDPKNIKQFGAYGDGEHDDTGALLQALTYGKEMNIPKGKYSIDTSLTISSIKLTGEAGAELSMVKPLELISGEFNNIKFTSDGSTSSLLKLKSDTETSLIFHNCEFNDNTVNNFINGEATSDTTYVEITNTKFDGCKEQAIRLMGTGKKFIADKCEFTNIGNASSSMARGISLGSTTDSNIDYDEVLITNCTFNNLTTADNTGSETAECQAIRIRAYSSIIADNFIDGINGKGQDHEGIYVKGYKTIITGNQLNNCGFGNGAITLKPVTYGVISNNIVKTTGCCLYARGELNISDNEFISDFSARVHYNYDDSASYYVVDLSEGHCRFIDNYVEGSNLAIVSDTTGLFKCEISGSEIDGNKLKATYLNYVLNVTNSISEPIDFSNNNLILSNNNGIFRMNDYRNGFKLNVIDNKITGSYGEIASAASNMTSYIYELLLKRNTIDIENYSGSNLLAISNSNVSSKVELINNIITSSTNKAITNVVTAYTNVYLIDNDLTAIDPSRVILVAKSVDYIMLEGNKTGGALVRMNGAFSCNTIKVINNILTGSGMFTTNMLTAAVAYIIGNYAPYEMTSYSYLTATTLYNAGNIQYNA